MVSKSNFKARNEFSTSKKHYLDTKIMFLSFLEANILLNLVSWPAGPSRALWGPKKRIKECPNKKFTSKFGFSTEKWVGLANTIILGTKFARDLSIPTQAYLLCIINR